jgi:hypothetical protein
MAATTQEVLNHHLDTLGKGDLAGVMADYAPESRLFTPNGMLEGPEAIHAPEAEPVCDGRQERDPQSEA